jgi:hypothetical protein
MLQNSSDSSAPLYALENVADSLSDKQFAEVVWAAPGAALRVVSARLSDEQSGAGR